MLARLQQTVGHLTFSQIAGLTGVHPETVRRYMTRGRPPAYFVASICKMLGVSLEWLMNGSTNGGDQAQTGLTLNSRRGRAPSGLSEGDHYPSLGQTKTRLPTVLTFPTRMTKNTSQKIGSIRNR